MSNENYFNKPTNYVQYVLPFNYSFVSQTADGSADTFMKEVLNLRFWEGENAASNHTITENVYEPLSELSDEENIIHHLAIYANEGCKFYITNCEYFEEDRLPPGVENAGWYAYTQVYQIGEGNKLEFINVRIRSVGCVDTSLNTKEYFGKNALIDMATAMAGEVDNLYHVSDDIPIKILDPFIKEVDEDGE